MRFIIDAQLPPALAECFKGHLAEHVQDIGLRDAEDSPIWKFALQNACVIVTKDEDFARRFHQSKNAPIIIWLRIGNCSKRALTQWFSPLVPTILQRIEEGERLIEVR